MDEPTVDSQLLFQQLQTQQKQVEVILARMEVKLDHALTRGEDHETRLRVLEKKVWVASGIAAAVSGLASSWLTNVLGPGIGW